MKLLAVVHILAIVTAPVAFAAAADRNGVAAKVAVEKAQPQAQPVANVKSAPDLFAASSAEFGAIHTFETADS